MERTKGLTVQEQYLVSKMNWWTQHSYGGEEKPRPATRLRMMLQRRRDEWNWKKIKEAARFLREQPFDSSNVDKVIGALINYNEVRIQVWTTKKLLMMKLALAELEIEGKSDNEIRRMILLEAL